MIDLNELCKVTLANANLRNRNGGHIKTDTRSMLKQSLRRLRHILVMKKMPATHWQQTVMSKI